MVKTMACNPTLLMYNKITLQYKRNLGGVNSSEKYLNLIHKYLSINFLNTSSLSLQLILKKKFGPSKISIKFFLGPQEYNMLSTDAEKFNKSIPMV